MGLSRAASEARKIYELARRMKIDNMWQDFIDHHRKIANFNIFALKGCAIPNSKYPFNSCKQKLYFVCCLTNSGRMASIPSQVCLKTMSFLRNNCRWWMQDWIWRCVAYPAKRCHQPWSWVSGANPPEIEDRTNFILSQKILSIFQRTNPVAYL